MQTRLSEACARWGLTEPSEIAVTPRAHVFRIRRGDDFAALKLLTAQGVRSEGTAPALLRHWSGFGTVDLLEASTDAHLLSWLSGPSAGDLARAGDDEGSAHLLARAGMRLHQAPLLAGVETLEEMLAPLFTHPAPTPDMTKASVLARSLLASSPAPALLHGDLHHDNLLGDGAGEWRPIDPKGILGDPAFDYANAFRNPVGMEEAARDPARAHRLAALFAEETGLSPARLLGWAGVLPALSIVWNRVEAQPEADDHSILATLLPLAQAAQRA